ncbi:unnamed protein product [Schistosoma margrebowiei]|uniref:Uncharacterized protein n=1 Tax=Schistosoma margrebowiei TaxID=48269 RepID=A0A183LT15_9TREM|nr:unnamed protein product [Schistosoma margrebowiei]
MQLDDLDFADDLALLSHTQQQMQENTTSVAAVSAASSTQNTSDSLARHYQQQPTVGENKPDPSGGRSQEEALQVDRTHVGESTQLRHMASHDLESSRPKEKRKTKEHITERNRDRHEKNQQQLDRTRKEGPGHNGLENDDQRLILH